MIIETLNRSYELLQKLLDNEQMNIMLARNQKEEKCLLAVLKNEEQIHRFIPFCTRQKENFPFEDFMDFFSKDGWLYMVFRHYEFPVLEHYLENEKVRFIERLYIGKSLLERMVLLHIPFYLQYEALGKDNIRVDDSGQVYFNFYLHEPEQLLNSDMEDISHRLYRIFFLLFEEERKEESCPLLEAYMEKVKENTYKNNMELLKAYERVLQAVMPLWEAGALKPSGPEFKLWEKAKRLAGYLKKIVIAAFFAALIWYLVYTIRHPSYQEGDKLDFEQIGTLEIRESRED